MTRELGWFVDTNILLNVLTRTALGKHLIESLQFRARQSTPLMSVVSQAELFSLGSRNDWGKPKLDRLEELLNELVIVDVVASARPLIIRYAELDNESYRQGHTMSKNDLWIAASASVSGAMLLTTDRDFDHLNPTHLKVWWFDPKAEQWPSSPP